MILCNSPVPILKMEEYGYEVPFITVGNISNRLGAVQIARNTFISPEERDAFVKLIDRGVKVYIQNVPNDPREDVTSKLKNL